jgi:hypothetical protein
MPLLTTEYQFTFDGFAFGGEGSPYQILSVDGLEGVPGIRSQDDNRGFSDGMFSGQDFFSGRTISIIFNTFGNASGSAMANFNAIQAVLLPQTTGTSELFFYLPPSTTQYVNARVRGLRTTVDPNYTYGYIVSQVDFFCPDPRYYNYNEQTATMAYSAPTGRIYNRTYNLTYGGGSATLQTTVTNNGWATTYPTILVKGPIINPVVGNSTTGNTLSFTKTMIATDELEIDLLNKLITFNGASARNLLASGTWFAAPPGNSTFTFTGTGTANGVTEAIITWYSAFV